jgi:heme/copper-type cytochrome/quinol oxidase subunit 3
MEIAVSTPLQNRKIASDGVIGMIFLLATEAMFFAGLISAYVVNRAGAKVWLPYGQPRLPIEITALNTAILIASLVALFLFSKKFNSNYNAAENSRKLLAIAILLGGIFISVQGTEWIKLIGYGLTTTSSLYGSFFYLIIGAHAIHAIAGLLILFYLYYAIKNSDSFEVSKNKITICSMYWYFVVGIWPLLYTLVYLM